MIRPFLWYIVLLFCNSLYAQSTCDKVQGEQGAFFENKNAVAEQDFNTVIQSVAAQPSDAAKINTIAQQLEGKSLDVQQVSILISLVQYDAAKMIIYEMVYPDLFDKQNITMLRYQFSSGCVYPALVAITAEQYHLITTTNAYAVAQLIHRQKNIPNTLEILTSIALIDSINTTTAQQIGTLFKAQNEKLDFYTKILQKKQIYIYELDKIIASLQYEKYRITLCQSIYTSIRDIKNKHKLKKHFSAVGFQKAFRPNN